MWKKILVISGVILGVGGACIGIMAGMTHAETLAVAYPDGVKSYTIRRPYGDYLMAKMRHHGSWVEEYESMLRENGDSVKTLAEMSSDFETVVHDMLSHEREKRESTIDYVKGGDTLFRYNIGEDGLTVSAGGYESLMWALDSGETAKELYVVDRALTLDELKRRTTLLGTYTTEYATSGEARRTNIHKATEYIDGTIVEANGIFSYNDTVGERTAERGFREANIIVNGEYVKGYGGGVCQVSTTLYNAWVLSGLGVEYATSHSLPPHYVPLSRDAMVSRHNDMLLVNNSETPIYVRGYTGNNSVTFEIYGMESGYTYDMESETIRELPIETKVYGNVNENEEYDEIVLSSGVPGYESRGYLVTLDREGKQIKKEVIREDTYRCQPRIVERIRKTGVDN